MRRLIAVSVILLLVSLLLSLAQPGLTERSLTHPALAESQQPAVGPEHGSELQTPAWSSELYLPLLVRSGPTVTPRPTITPTSTPSPTLTPTPTPKPVEPCRELILNGGFEGQDDWHMPATSGGAHYTEETAYSGRYSAELGQGALGPGVTHAMLYQTITIPAGVDRVTLTFWYYPVSLSLSSGDYQRFALLDGTTSHLELSQLARLHSDNRTWQGTSFDLTAYKGRNLDVAFEVVNDFASGGGNTWMYVDEVSVQACTGTAIPAARTARAPAPSSSLTPVSVDGHSLAE